MLDNAWWFLQCRMLAATVELPSSDPIVRVKLCLDHRVFEHRGGIFHSLGREKQI